MITRFVTIPLLAGLLGINMSFTMVLALGALMLLAYSFLEGMATAVNLEAKSQVVDWYASEIVGCETMEDVHTLSRSMNLFFTRGDIR